MRRFASAHALPALVALAGLGALTSSARATWSIILIDTRTREVGIASATCLTGFDLRQGSPVVVTGVGAAAAQSFVESTLVTRTYIRDRLLEGMAPADILAGLPTVDGDHQRRQYGIADASGRAASFTGSFAGAWAGGVSGQFSYTHLQQTGTIAYAVQGNVLTGPSVIAAALDAAQQTQGDLPARLMAAMQAARAQGGDGRCSCSPATPEACGAPPADFTTSAQIGYVIVARLGDTDRCGGVYPGALNAQLLTADVLASPATDVALTTPSGTLLRYENSSARRLALPAFTPGAPTLAPAVTQSGLAAPFALAAADLTGDGRSETIVGSALAPASLLSFARSVQPPTALLVTDGPRRLLTTDIDRDGDSDIVSLAPGGVVRVFTNAAGEMTEATSVTLGQQPADMSAVDIDGDGDDDIAVAIGSQVVIVENRTPVAGAVTLLARTGNALAGPARSIVTGDFDGDGDDDLAVGINSTASIFQVLRNDAGVVTVRPGAAARVAPACLAAGDVTGDGIDDLLIAGTGGLATHRGVLNSPGGVAFSGGSQLRVGAATAGPVFMGLFDADGDGDGDIATRDGSGLVTVLENRGSPAGQPFGAAGTWVTTSGCADGDYFLNLNVANVPDEAPDVVPVLQSQFDAWRAGLVGKVDGVQSGVVVPRLTAAGAPADIFITLRDWQGNLVTSPASFDISRTGDTSACTLSDATPTQPGVYAIRVTPGPAPVVVQLRIRVTLGAARPVVLMPLPTLVIGPACGDIDFNNNTVFPEDQDVIDFFRVLAGEACPSCDSIDFNNNGVFPEDQDVIDFFNVLAGGAC